MWTTLLLQAAILGVQGLSIEPVEEAVSARVGEGVTLHCPLSYDKEKESEVVVKWFFGSSLTPFYQWVPALDVGPQVIERAAPGPVDLEYRGEGDQPRGRILRLLEVTLAQAGEYTCQVSSFTEETSATTRLDVYVPPSSMTVTSTSSSTLVTLTCTVTGTFPLPSVALSWTQKLLPHSTSSPAPVLLHGLYSSTVVTSLPLEEVGREDVALCSLALPGHQYTREEQVTMLQDNIPEKYLAMFSSSSATGEEEKVEEWEEEEAVQGVALERPAALVGEVEVGFSGGEERRAAMATTCLLATLVLLW